MSTQPTNPEREAPNIDQWKERRSPQTDSADIWSKEHPEYPIELVGTRQMRQETQERLAAFGLNLFDILADIDDNTKVKINLHAPLLRICRSEKENWPHTKVEVRFTYSFADLDRDAHLDEVRERYAARARGDVDGEDIIFGSGSTAYSADVAGFEPGELGSVLDEHGFELRDNRPVSHYLGASVDYGEDGELVSESVSENISATYVFRPRRSDEPTMDDLIDLLDEHNLTPAEAVDYLVTEEADRYSQSEWARKRGTSQPTVSGNASKAREKVNPEE